MVFEEKWIPNPAAFKFILTSLLIIRKLLINENNNIAGFLSNDVVH